jgi:15-cis-phytoene synthase
MNLETAYERCEQITRTEAKNFSYGIRLLAAPERKAMSALYALARRIDDIGDGDDAIDEKLGALREVREKVHLLRTDARRVSDDPIYCALAHASTRFPIPLEAFDDMIDGVEQDCSGTFYDKPDDTIAYCRLVAGSVGRLSLGVFGCTDRARATQLADDLGVALQLTNILRDIVEDRGMGRVYLPAEDIKRFDCELDLTGPKASVIELITFECSRARSWYERGLPLLPLLDRRSRACVAAMSGIYRRLLDRIEQRPEAVLDGRMSLSTSQKLQVAVRAIATGRA